MRAYIQIKQLGKRKCSIEKIPIDFPVPPVNVQGLIEAITNALQSYEDGIFRIFMDDTEAGDLSSPIQLKEESTLTFIRLAMLSGRLW